MTTVSEVFRPIVYGLTEISDGPVGAEGEMRDFLSDHDNLGVPPPAETGGAGTRAYGLGISTLGDDTSSSLTIIGWT